MTELAHHNQAFPMRDEPEAKGLSRPETKTLVLRARRNTVHVPENQRIVSVQARASIDDEPKKLRLGGH